MRFDPNASDRAGALRYFGERAFQLRIDGFRPHRQPEPLYEAGLEWGLRAFLMSPEEVRHQSIYVYAGQRGRGLCARALQNAGDPVVTVPDCNIEAYLQNIRVPYVVAARVTATREYLAVAAFYAGRTAQRSQVPLMRHIDEGLTVLARKAAGGRAMRAYCLHPLFQGDAALFASYERLSELTEEPQVLALALEYRNIANASLSKHEFRSPLDIPLSPLAEVNAMLLADKVQNYKDFLRHHLVSHPRATELRRYFTCWLERLGVSEQEFERLCRDLDAGASWGPTDDDGAARQGSSG